MYHSFLVILLQCQFILENKCDLVNFSYGEPTMYANSNAPNMFLASEFVEQYGVIFCGSAGNNGPSITTADAPSNCCSAAISVGAYVSSEMCKAENSEKQLKTSKIS